MWCEKEIDTSVYDITVLNNIIASNIVDVSDWLEQAEKLKSGYIHSGQKLAVP